LEKGNPGREKERKEERKIKNTDNKGPYSLPATPKGIARTLLGTKYYILYSRMEHIIKWKKEKWKGPHIICAYEKCNCKGWLEERPLTSAIPKII
jgi:hypothetical protein